MVGSWELGGVVLLAGCCRIIYMRLDSALVVRFRKDFTKEFNQRTRKKRRQSQEV